MLIVAALSLCALAFSAMTTLLFGLRCHLVPTSRPPADVQLRWLLREAAPPPPPQLDKWLEEYGLQTDDDDILYVVTAAEHVRRFGNDTRGVVYVGGEQQHGVLPHDVHVRRVDNLAELYSAIILPLTKRGFTVVHVLDELPRKLPPTREFKQPFDVIRYHGSCDAYLPTPRTARFLSSLLVGTTGVAYDALAKQAQLRVLWLPRPMQFASLELCNGEGVYYECQGNPTCDVDNAQCVHDGRLIKFEDAHNWRRFHAQREEREAVWVGALDRMQREKRPNSSSSSPAPPRHHLLVMSFNIGFAHLFANWVCSLYSNGLDVGLIQQHTIVLGTDSEAIAFAEQLGFFALTLAEFEHVKRWTGFGGMTPRAAETFGTGPHKKINLLLKFGVPLDLVNLGYTVMTQDVDLVWSKNALDELIKLSSSSNGSGDADEYDAMFIQEKRPFAEDAQVRPWMRTETAATGFPEANTGLYVLRPTLVMKQFLEVLLEANRLQQWYSRDQVLWNTLLYHKDAPHVRFKLLPSDQFVPGLDLRRMAKQKQHNALPTSMIAAHASDTAGFAAKYQRLRELGLWYLTDKQCSVPYAICAAIPGCYEPLHRSVTAANFT